MTEVNWKEAFRMLGTGLFAMYAASFQEYQKLSWFSFRKKLVLAGATAVLSEAANAFRKTWTSLHIMEERGKADDTKNT